MDTLEELERVAAGIRAEFPADIEQHPVPAVILSTHYWWDSHDDPRSLGVLKLVHEGKFLSQEWYSVHVGMEYVIAYMILELEAEKRGLTIKKVE